MPNGIGLQYQQEGYAIVDNYLDLGTCAEYVDRLNVSGKYIRVIKEYSPSNKVINGQDVSTGLESSSHSAIDMHNVSAIIPGVAQLYTATLEFVSSALGISIIESPFERSRYYVKKYCSPGDRQGWHYDTNCLSIVIYLTSNNDGCTEIIYDNGDRVEVFAVAGRMMILDGRRLWHRAKPVMSRDKVTLLFNYYETEHEDRPGQIDNLIFG